MGKVGGKRPGAGRPKGAKDKNPHQRVKTEAMIACDERNKLKPYTDAEGIDYNARQIEHTLRIHEIASHANRKDIASLRSCFIAYMQLCQSDGFKISNLGAYASMGMTYVDFCLFAKKDDPAIKEFASFVKTTCALNREALIADNKINPVIGIFWQRNYDGLRNDTEQQQSIAETDENYNNSAAYREKYKNLIGE